jgi:prolipoprotein diacylglyceryl transferase
LHPTIDLDFFQLDAYTALVALGVLAGLLVAYLFLRTRSRRASAFGAFLDGALVALAAGWAGARAYHVLTHWEYYVARPEEIAQLGLGGLGIRGGLVLAFLAVFVYARGRRFSFRHLADAAALGLSIGQAVGWAGALVEGANYGVVSDSRIAMELPDLYGLVQPRFPLQHAEIALCAVLFVGLLWQAAQRRTPGTLFLMYLLIASPANALLGFQRGDETAYAGPWRVDQIVDLAFFFCALIAWLRSPLESVLKRAGKSPTPSNG